MLGHARGLVWCASKEVRSTWHEVHGHCCGDHGQETVERVDILRKRLLAGTHGINTDTRTIST